MIAFSERARRAIAVLFRPYNDIDVYVEDTTARNVYEILINRVLDGRARVTRVIQLGPRSKVVEECAIDQLPRGRPRLYLLDGDMDLLANVPAPELKHLYRLSVYASENLVYCESAIAELAYECMPNTDRATLSKSLNLDEVLRDLSEVLLPLFHMYGAAWLLDRTIATSGFHVAKLCTETGTALEIDKAKVQARIDAVRQELLLNHDADVIDSTLAIVRMSAGEGVDALVKYVSGKTYLLPLLFHLLRRKASYSGTIEQLKVRLARHASLDIDPGFASAIETASRDAAA